MSTNADSLVREAIAIYRAGEKEQARALLLQAVDLDENHEQAWLWLSAVVDSVEDQITCLENVLTINPENEKARQGIRLLNDKQVSVPSESTPQTAQEADEDAFASVSFTQPDPLADIGLDPEPVDSEEDLPDDVAWDIIETSSASAQRPASELSSSHYNDWIAGLNIGSNEAVETFGDIEEEEPAFNASPFIGDGDLMADDAPFELDRSIFGLEEDELPAAEPFSASPFSADFDQDFEDEPRVSSPVPPSAMTAEALPVRSTPLPSAAPRSPVTAAEDDFRFAEMDSDALFGDELSGDNYDDADFGTVDPAEFFKFIPAEIRATRLPGTNERYPVLVVVGLLLLVLLNGGALALVYMTLSGSL
ncbi:MAG: hypothetical protein K8J31_29770 [Anaerolineae bacterium]|nr:hypothetical protein [Anaerolineae bacterium]